MNITHLSEKKRIGLLRWNYFHLMESETKLDKKCDSERMKALQYDASERAFIRVRREHGNISQYYHDESIANLEWLSFMTAN